MHAMTSVTGVRIEIAKGCSTVVYITFITFKEAPQVAMMKLLDDLLKQGATLMRIPGLEDQSGILRLQAEGLSHSSLLCALKAFLEVFLIIAMCPTANCKRLCAALLVH